MTGLTYDLHIHSCLSPCGDDDMTPAGRGRMNHVRPNRAACKYFLINFLTIYTVSVILSL